DPGDEPSISAREEGDHVGHLCWFGRTAHGGSAVELLDVTGGNVADGVGGGETRCDGVDAHPSSGELDGEGAGQIDHGALGGVVHRHTGITTQACDRGDVDDAAPGHEQVWKECLSERHNRL